MAWNSPTRLGWSAKSQGSAYLCPPNTSVKRIQQDCTQLFCYMGFRD